MSADPQGQVRRSRFDGCTAARRRRLLSNVGALLGAALCLGCGSAWADSIETLREFVREVRSGRAEFTQTVASPDGAKKRTSTGSFEFARPGKFRFTYRKPYEQVIVSDGKKVWLHDIDLNQVSIRPADQVLGATPAALLSGTGLERDFDLTAQPQRDGIDWVRAVPKAAEGNIAAVQVGFKGRTLAALEITDAFGQRSMMQFTDVVTNPQPALPDSVFRFALPKGAEVIEQR